MIEPIAWLITKDDGVQTVVTADPNLDHAHPLYTLDIKDLLILELYREQHQDALSALYQAPSG